MLRGEIRLVNLDPVVGAEANKRRPAIMATRFTIRSYRGERFAFGPMMPGAITLDVML